MGKGSVLMAVLLTLAALAPLPALADEARSQAADALEKTDRRIEVADHAVDGTAGDPARSELTAARHSQARARAAFTTLHYPEAVSAAIEARDHADRAIAIVRNLPDPGRVQSQLERTRHELQRAAHQIDRCADPRARQTLGVANEMQQRAEGALAESRYLAALQLTLSARERGEKATQFCDGTNPVADTVTEELKVTDELISRAAESLTPHSPLGRGALRRAQALQVQAQAEARGAHYDSALRLTRSARDLADRAARRAGAVRRR